MMLLRLIYGIAFLGTFATQRDSCHRSSVLLTTYLWLFSGLVIRLYFLAPLWFKVAL